MSSKYRHLYQFCYVKIFSTIQNGNLLLLDDPGRVRSQITSVVYQIQRFDFDCNLVVMGNVIIRSAVVLRSNPLYSIHSSLVMALVPAAYPEPLAVRSVRPSAVRPSMPPWPPPPHRQLRCIVRWGACSTREHVPHNYQELVASSIPGAAPRSREVGDHSGV